MGSITCDMDTDARHVQACPGCLYSLLSESCPCQAPSEDTSRACQTPLCMSHQLMVAPAVEVVEYQRS